MESEGRVERIRYRFIGRVQRRGFRFACITCARGQSMTGWVRNERDGSVTAEAQAPSEAQLAFVRRLSELVPGFGDEWSVASERSVELVEGEREFGLRRY